MYRDGTAPNGFLLYVGSDEGLFLPYLINEYILRKANNNW